MHGLGERSLECEPEVSTTTTWTLCAEPSRASIAEKSVGTFGEAAARHGVAAEIPDRAGDIDAAAARVEPARAAPELPLRNDVIDRRPDVESRVHGQGEDRRRQP